MASDDKFLVGASITRRTRINPKARRSTGRDLRRCGRRRAANARLASAQDRLGPVGDLKLGKDVRDVIADRLGSQTEPVGDLGVGQVLLDEDEDLVLSFGWLW